MIRVKICGITRWEDARLACEQGAWALGFNFYEKSPRAIAPATAWGIRRRLPESVEAIGVFVNWKPTAVVALARSLELSGIQLHGDECAAHVNFCAKRLPVIKAFRVDAGFSAKSFAFFRTASAFLLDGARPGQYGGSGETTDWPLAARAARRHRVILAGGLTPENVAAAIYAVRPYAVDVTSGVESRPGKKDPGKLREFLREAERAGREIAAESKPSEIR